MKTYLQLSLLVALGTIALAGCTGRSASDDRALDSAIDVDTAIVADLSENEVDHNLPFVTEKFKEKKGDNELEVELPKEGNQVLLDSVRHWINDELGGSFRGDFADNERFFRHYALQLGRDPDLTEYGGYSQDEIDVEYKNDRIVTYECSSYLYEGGAHGISNKRGITFLQADGSRFNRRCISSYSKIQPLIVEGLKRYFNVKTDAQLLEALIGVKSVKDIQAPAVTPWIVEEGVVFSYEPYEIAPYSAGIPTFTIPYSKIEPFLTEEGKSFFR